MNTNADKSVKSKFDNVVVQLEQMISYAKANETNACTCGSGCGNESLGLWYPIKLVAETLKNKPMIHLAAMIASHTAGDRKGVPSFKAFGLSCAPIPEFINVLNEMKEECEIQLDLS